MNFGNPYPYMQMPQNPPSYLPQRPPMDFGSQMQTQPAQQGFIVRPVTPARCPQLRQTSELPLISRR